jgi:hypothetical protein
VACDEGSGETDDVQEESGQHIIEMMASVLAAAQSGSVDMRNWEKYKDELARPRSIYRKRFMELPA